MPKTNNNSVTIDLAVYDGLKEQIASLTEENASALDAILELANGTEKRVLVRKELYIVNAESGEKKLQHKRVIEALNFDDIKEEVKEHYKQEFGALSDEVVKLTAQVEKLTRKNYEMEYLLHALKTRSLWKRILNKD